MSHHVVVEAALYRDSELESDVPLVLHSAYDVEIRYDVRRLRFKVAYNLNLTSLLRESIPTDGALEGPLSAVRHGVVGQLLLRAEPLLTDVAGVDSSLFRN